MRVGVRRVLILIRMHNLKLAIYAIIASWFCSSLALPISESDHDIKVSIKGEASIATTDDNFVCATLDMWPPTKCNYAQCPWGQAGLFTLDLNNKILLNAIKAFNPLRIRIGGSLQDQLLYNVGNVKKCQQFKRKDGALFGFTQGCLTMDKWDELNTFFSQTGAKITFGLNALIGRKKSKAKNSTLWIGDWNPHNARDFMNYTISKGYKIDSYEFGNELCSAGVEARVSAEQYGKDMIVLKKLVQQLYPNQSTQPKVLGPGGFYDDQWFQSYLQVSGPNVVYGLTHHIYNLGPGDDPTLVERVRDPKFLDTIAEIYKEVAITVNKSGPWAGAWVGEAGGAYNSGSKTLSHSFGNGFWYLDQLGISSKFNHKVYCRQTLIGGNYGLLNTSTFIPNPDFYSALLWHRLMGREVLAADHVGAPYLRAYSHCSKQKPGISLLLINLSNSTMKVSVDKDGEVFRGSKQREEYHLTPKDGNILSDVVLLNGTPLLLSTSSEIPSMNPKLVHPSFPISLAPNSITFVVIPDFNSPACN